MIDMTENARKELEAYFADKDKGTIRVFLAPGGCSGPRLQLALDEPGTDDTTTSVGGFDFCINKELLAKVEGATIDLTYMGFTVEPRVPLPQAAGGGCSGCGAGSSCCGH